MKKLFLICVSSLLLGSSAFAQSDGFVFLCDSNGIGLPGFFLNWSNLVGTPTTAQLPTNVVLSAQLLSVSNTLATNFSSALTTVSNSTTSFQNWADGTNNVFGAPGGSNVTSVGNTLALGGAANTIYASTAWGAFLLGGTSNTMVSASANGGILGALTARLDYSPQSVILGGAAGYVDLSTNCATLAGLSLRIDYGANRSAAIGGATNAIFGGINNVILGGANNTIGQTFGWNGVYDGPLTANNSCAGGVGAWPVFSGSFIWCDDEGATNWLRNTTNNQVLFRAKNGFGINTNFTGTNALAVSGNADFSSVSIGGVGIGTLYSPTVTSNGLSTLWNYNLTTTSNALQTQLTSLSAQDVTTSNNLAARIVATNTALVALVATTSNSFAASIGPAKAFTATLPATYSSIGIGFSTPLMPDGNYSVELTPQDQNTAEAALNGMPWWVGSKNASGFTIYVPFATNAFNLNFECIVRENTQ